MFLIYQFVKAYYTKFQLAISVLFHITPCGSSLYMSCGSVNKKIFVPMQAATQQPQH
jgi:hypothetical protein